VSALIRSGLVAARHLWGITTLWQAFVLNPDVPRVARLLENLSSKR